MKLNNLCNNIKDNIIMNYGNINKIKKISIFAIYIEINKL